MQCKIRIRLIMLNKLNYYKFNIKTLAKVPIQKGVALN